MKATYINIHTHRPTGRGVELQVAGVHPWEASLSAIRALSERLLTPSLPSIQAIGEIGLDKMKGAEWVAQKNAFETQLTLAEDHKLPVIIHCVRAFAAIMDELRRYQLPAVIFHGFIGSAQQAREAVKRGYYLSFGERAFSSPKTLEAMRATPINRFFLETDDAECSIEQIYTLAADALKITIEELQVATTANYERIFETNNE